MTSSSERVTHAHAENVFLRDVIRNSGVDTVIYNADGSLFFTTLDRGGNKALLSTLRALMPEALRGEADVVRKAVGGRTYQIKSFVSAGADGKVNCADYRAVTTKNNKHAKRMEPDEMTVVYPKRENGMAYRYVIEYNTESDEVTIMTQGEYNDRYSPNWNGGEKWH